MFMKADEFVRSGALGRITGINSRFTAPFHRKGAQWRCDAAVAGGGHFLDVGSHAVDILVYLFGPLGVVEGWATHVASSHDGEDCVVLNFRTDAGALSSMTWNFAGGSSDDTTRITGSDGEVTFPMVRSGSVKWEGATGVQTFDLPFPEHVAQPLIQSVVDDLLGLGTCPSTGEFARRTSRVMDKVFKAFYGGREDPFRVRPDTWSGLKH